MVAMLGLGRVDSTGTFLCLCTCMCVHILVWIFGDSSSFHSEVSLLRVVWAYAHTQNSVCVGVGVGLVTCLWWIEKFRLHLTRHWPVCFQALSDRLMHHHRAASVCLPLMSPAPSVYRASPLFPLPELCKKTSLKWRLFRMLHFISKLPHWSQHSLSQAAFLESSCLE